MSNNAQNNTLSVPFVGAGVRQDLKQLFLKFEETKSVKIKDYADVFREMRFDTILKQRICPTEYVEFAEYLLQNAANYFRIKNEIGEERRIEERIFGIYSCYTLYNLQPMDHVCQIQVTSQQLDELMSLEKILNEERNLEAVACIHSLVYSNAFHITLFQSSYDPATHKKYLGEEENTGSINGTILPFDRFISVLNSDIFGEMSYIHNSYVKAKKDLGITDTSICLVDKRNPYKEAQTILNKHQNLLKEYSERLTRSAENGDDSAPVFENESAGTSRSNLKNKAYTANMKHTRNRRYLDPNMDENFSHLETLGDLAKELMNEPIHESSQKMSRKTRKPKKRKTSVEPESTIDNHELASQVLKDSMSGLTTTVKQENESDTALVGGKKSTSGTSAKRIRAPKKKDPKIVEVESVDVVNEPTASTGDLNGELRSPLKKSPRKASKISDEWTSKLSRLKKKEVAADKALERLKNRIQMEDTEDE